MLVSEAPLSMLPVPAKLYYLKIPRARILRNRAYQVHSTIRWCYRRQSTHRTINLWRHLARATIPAQMLCLASRNTERCAASAPAAFGEMLDDVMGFLRRVM